MLEYVFLATAIGKTSREIQNVARVISTAAHEFGKRLVTNTRPDGLFFGARRLSMASVRHLSFAQTLSSSGNRVSSWHVGLLCRYGFETEWRGPTICCRPSHFHTMERSQLRRYVRCY